MLLAAFLVPIGAGCTILDSRRRVEAQLDAAQSVAFECVEQVPVSDLPALGSDYVPLGQRLALIEVAGAEQFAALRRAAPALRIEPDFSRGMLVGVISWLGTPLTGGSGVELVGLQHAGGTGLLAVRYHPGTYLPDGAATLAIGYVPARVRVQVVSVGSTRYYVDEQDR